MKVHTIQEFIKEYYANGEQKFMGENFEPHFVDKLLDDFGIPEDTVEFLGCYQNDYDAWTEYMILYRFSKNTGAEYLGSCLKLLGKMITRLRDFDYSFGIQEVDVIRPDGYYVMLYGQK